jgi:hypothetical protein
MPLYLVHCSKRVRPPTLTFLIVLVALASTLSRLGCALAGQLAADSDPMDEHALFQAVGAMYGLDPALFEAIAAVESHNNRRAISSKGALGLMQLMPATASQFKVADPFDPVESALGAAKFLDYLRGLKDCKDIPKLLAAYNAGPSAVRRYHGIPPYTETRRYVRTVLRLYLLAESPEEDRQHTTQHMAEPKTAARHEPASDDQALLEQLADLKRQREVAARRSLSR